MNLTSEEKDTIAKMRAKKAKEFPVRPLEDYTDEEKIKWFDKRYQYARSILTQVMSEHEYEKDAKHWMFEENMNLLAHKGRSGESRFWKLFNKNSN